MPRHPKHAPSAPRHLRFDHHRDWLRLGRWCMCGRQWKPCLASRRLRPLPTHSPARPTIIGRRPTWDGPTAINWNQAGVLTTPAQEWRANGGRW
jgi:hypothetical protein